MSCYTSITGIWNFVLVSSVWLQNDTFLFIFLDWRNSNELGHFLRSQLDELSWTLVLLFLQQRGWMHLWTCFAKLLKNAVGVALASWEDQTLVSFPQAYHHYGAKKLRRPIWISIYRKVMSSRLSVSSTFKDHQTVYEGEIWCLCTVIFGPKSSKLNSRPVYCSRLYGMLYMYPYDSKRLFFRAPL